eukprot:scaffold2847_cov86-Cylindrotheca_fusiformis.AAC.2
MPNVAPSDKPELESFGCILRLGGFSCCGVRVGFPVASDGEVEITLLGDMLLVGAAELILGATDGRMEGMVLGATESVGTLDGNIVEGLILGEAEGKIVGVADGFILGSKDGRMDGRLLGAVESSFRTTLLDGNVEGLMLLLLEAGQLYHCFQSRASVELYFVSPASLPSCDGFVPNKLQAPQIVSSPAGGVTSIHFSSSSKSVKASSAGADVMPSSSLSVYDSPFLPSRKKNNNNNNGGVNKKEPKKKIGKIQALA